MTRIFLTPFRLDLVTAALLLGVFMFSPSGLSSEDESKKKAPSPADPKPDEFVDLQNRILGWRAKIKLREENLEKLIQQKQAEKDSKAVEGIIRDMKKEHGEMQKEIEEYNRENAQFQFRFPEKGLATDRRSYRRIEPRTLDEIEGELTLDMRVKRTVRKMKEVYRRDDQHNSPDSEKDKPSSKDKKSELKVEADPLLQPVIIETK